MTLQPIACAPLPSWTCLMAGSRPASSLPIRESQWAENYNVTGVIPEFGYEEFAGHIAAALAGVAGVLDLELPCFDLARVECLDLNVASVQHGIIRHEDVYRRRANIGVAGGLNGEFAY